MRTKKYTKNFTSLDFKFFDIYNNENILEKNKTWYHAAYHVL